MPINNEFSGYHKEPNDSDILKLLSLLNYAKSKFGISYSDYVDSSNGPISKSSHSNAESKRSMSAAVYAAYTKKLHQRLIAQDAQTGNYTRLHEIDTYIRPLVADVFPDIGSDLGIEETPNTVSLESFLAPHAAQGSSALVRLKRKFQKGGHIYRYAKNSSELHAKDPRLAVGSLSFRDDGSSSYLCFEIRYRVDSSQDLNEAHDSVISGRVMQFNSFLVFIGIEKDKENPFFMVMKTGMSENRFKGIILRKHPKKSYFASRVMLASDVPAKQMSTSKFLAQDLPEVTERQLELIMNLATNGGRGILMLDED